MFEATEGSATTHLLAPEAFTSMRQKIAHCTDGRTSLPLRSDLIVCDVNEKIGRVWAAEG